jgi:ABC-type sulfate transport system permease component
VLPGFDLALGITLLYLGVIVLIPLSAAFLKTFSMTWPAFRDAVTAPRVLAAYRLTFGASLAARSSMRRSASSSPGCWCATGSSAGVSSMR